MNTNPGAIKILCYGDSNTYGQTPDRSGRYPANMRWTGLLQQKLGDGYYIIEEGLGGRTTDLEHPNPKKPQRNGFEYFKAALESHWPLDIILIMLGPNDMKTVYHRSPEEVAQALRQYPVYVREYCQRNKLRLPRIILVSPAYMDEHAPKFVVSMPSPGIYDEVSAQKSRQLASPIKNVADETGCEFFDAGLITKTGEDGCHLDAESHQKLANAFATIVEP